MTNIKIFFFSSRRRHTRLQGDWSSDVCSSDLTAPTYIQAPLKRPTARTQGDKTMEQLLYKVEDRPPMLITTVLLSLQHLLAALGGIIAVPLVFGGALTLPAGQIVALVDDGLLGSGGVPTVP